MAGHEYTSRKSWNEKNLNKTVDDADLQLEDTEKENTEVEPSFI